MEGELRQVANPRGASLRGKRPAASRTTRSVKHGTSDDFRLARGDRLNDPVISMAATRPMNFVSEKALDTNAESLGPQFREAGAKWKDSRMIASYKGSLDRSKRHSNSWVQFAIECRKRRTDCLDEERGGYVSGTGKDASIL